MAATLQVSNETEASFTRTTKDGRNLRYEMKVLQQPARARACGSGAKSSADRRPVDPPPVVELKIFDVEAKADITFSHNANFFLYTTLESARAIAPLRGSNNGVPAPFPVLTGTPVAGMAYLDRPVPAGYFIFPDLSVRHEGKYRLSFNLFEELKEDKDSDLHSTVPSPEHANNNLLRSSPMAPHAHVHFRLEVKSEPFVVYSAKKFPGLAESTSLSRVVAEQGCRVRIRRDVRMRRRDNKPSKDYGDEYEEEQQQQQQQQQQQPSATQYRPESYPTPESFNHNVAVERARSVSASSVDGNLHQYPQPVDRRSTHDSTYYNQPTYQPQPPVLAAPLPQQAVNFNSHLAFGSAPQYQAPTMPSSMPSSMPQQSHSMLQYSQPQSQQPQMPSAHSRHASNASNYEYTTPSSMHQQQMQYTSQPPPSYQDNMTQRPAPLQPVSQSSYPAIDNKFMNPQSYYSQPTPLDPRTSTPSNTQQLLPPLKTIQPLSDRPTSLASTLNPSSPTVAEYNPGGATGYPFSNHMNPARSSKRVYDRVFDNTHVTSSIVDGARPEAAGQDVLQIDNEEDGLIDPEEYSAQLRMLSYRRADGSRQHKKIPSPIS